jgi:hypothetical protein
VSPRPNRGTYPATHERLTLTQPSYQIELYRPNPGRRKDRPVNPETLRLVFDFLAAIGKVILEALTAGDVEKMRSVTDVLPNNTRLRARLVLAAKEEQARLQFGIDEEDTQPHTPGAKAERGTR